MSWKIANGQPHLHISPRKGIAEPFLKLTAAPLADGQAKTSFIYLAIFGSENTYRRSRLVAERAAAIYAGMQTTDGQSGKVEFLREDEADRMCPEADQLGAAEAFRGVFAFPNEPRGRSDGADEDATFYAMLSFAVFTLDPTEQLAGVLATALDATFNQVTRLLQMRHFHPFWQFEVGAFYVYTRQQRVLVLAFQVVQSRPDEPHDSP